MKGDIKLKKLMTLSLKKIFQIFYNFLLYTVWDSIVENTLTYLLYNRNKRGKLYMMIKSRHVL